MPDASGVLLTRVEAAEYLGVQPQTLAVWATTGRYQLPFVRIGRCVRYKVSDLDAWLERRTITSTGDAIPEPPAASRSARGRRKH
jgi:excisionase family DNA binding protein